MGKTVPVQDGLGMSYQRRHGLETLGAPTRKCDRCRRELNRTHYSMTPGLFDDHMVGTLLHSHPVCNACQIAGMSTGPARAIARFMQSLAMLDWQKHAPCSAWTLRGEGHSARKSCRCIDCVRRLMHPATGLERSQRRWDTLCGSCPVKAKCGEYGETSDSGGVWGGEVRPHTGETWAQAAQEEGSDVS